MMKQFYREIFPQVLYHMKEKMILIDVRSKEEFEKSHLAGSHLVPLSLFSKFVETYDPENEYVFICSHGYRSLQAALQAETCGFQKIFSLKGGLYAWEKENFPLKDDIDKN